MRRTHARTQRATTQIAKRTCPVPLTSLTNMMYCSLAKAGAALMSAAHARGTEVHECAMCQRASQVWDASTRLGCAPGHRYHPHASPSCCKPSLAQRTECSPGSASPFRPARICHHAQARARAGLGMQACQADLHMWQCGAPSAGRSTSSGCTWYSGMASCHACTAPAGQSLLDTTLAPAGRTCGSDNDHM